MKRSTLSLLAIAAIAMVSTPAFAADKPATRSMSTEKATNATVTEKELKGLTVLNQDGTAIGEIQGVNMDNAGRIHSVTFRSFSTDSHIGVAPAWGPRNNSASDWTRGVESLYLSQENVGS